MALHCAALRKYHQTPNKIKYNLQTFAKVTCVKDLVI